MMVECTHVDLSDLTSKEIVYNEKTNTNERFTSNAVETIPEPSSTALLGLGALAMLTRRRR